MWQWIVYKSDFIISTNNYWCESNIISFLQMQKILATIIQDYLIDIFLCILLKKDWKKKRTVNALLIFISRIIPFDRHVHFKKQQNKYFSLQYIENNCFFYVSNSCYQVILVYNDFGFIIQCKLFAYIW